MGRPSVYISMYSDMKQSRIQHKRLFITRFKQPIGERKMGMVISWVGGVALIKTIIQVFLYKWVIDIRYVYPRRKAKIIKLKPKKQDI